MNNIKGIIEKYNINFVEPLNKGWSKDKKYILTNDSNKYLLRVSSPSLYTKKKEQYELLKKIESLDIYCSRAIEFGTLEDGNVYILLSYLEGQSAEDVLPNLSNEEAYLLGIEAGKALQKLHSIPIKILNTSWKEKYYEKMPRKIKALRECKYKLPLEDFLIEYYENKSYLMDDRPLKFSHGDYHAGNMIVHNGKIGIIDFDKNTIADPYDELKPFCWNVFKSEYFETGLINGYFNNEVPEEFFKILKYYSVESLISHLPWSVQFGEEDIKTAYRVYDAMLEWWGNFNLDIPTWYKGVL